MAFLLYLSTQSALCNLPHSPIRTSFLSNIHARWTSPVHQRATWGWCIWRAEQSSKGLNHQPVNRRPALPAQLP